MLTDRQLYIFKSIVELYAKHGEPIGSKTLIELRGLDCSPATVRNDMKALEDAGLLEKTHSSSGRIPSEQGYRFYVDSLSETWDDKVDLEKRRKHMEMLYHSLDNPFQRIDDIIHSCAKILSSLTKYTAFVIGPEAEQNRLVSFRVTSLGNGQMMAIIVTDNGAVENLVFQLPPQVDYESMTKMVRIIEEELVGYPLSEVYRRLNNDIPRLIQRYAANVEHIFNQVIAIFEGAARNRLHVDGTLNLIDFIRDDDLDRLKAVYEILDSRRALVHLLDHHPADDINVRIGEELEYEELSNFSLISADYEVKDYGRGMIAILGPRNMPYRKNIQLIEAFQEVLPIVIERYYKHFDQ